MTIEEWRDVIDKLHAFDFTLAAVSLDKQYGEDNEYSKRMLDVSKQVINIKLDLMAQFIKEHPDVDAFEVFYPNDEGESNDD